MEEVKKKSLNTQILLYLITNFLKHKNILKTFKIYKKYNISKYYILINN